MQATDVPRECQERLVKCVDFASELERLQRDTQPSLERWEADLAAEAEVENSNNLDAITLCLACVQALSARTQDNSRALGHLQSLAERSVSSSSASAAVGVDECLFWEAIARYHLRDYREARLCCEKALMRNPDSVLHRRLLELVRERVRKEGWSGIGILLAVTLSAAVLGRWFGAAARERS